MRERVGTGAHAVLGVTTLRRGGDARPSTARHVGTSERHTSVHGSTHCHQGAKHVRPSLDTLPQGSNARPSIARRAATRERRTAVHRSTRCHEGATHLRPWDEALLRRCDSLRPWCDALPRGEERRASRAQRVATRGRTTCIRGATHCHEGKNDVRPGRNALPQGGERRASMVQRIATRGRTTCVHGATRCYKGENDLRHWRGALPRGENDVRPGRNTLPHAGDAGPPTLQPGSEGVLQLSAPRRLIGTRAPLGARLRKRERRTLARACVGRPQIPLITASIAPRSPSSIAFSIRSDSRSRPMAAMATRFGPAW